MLTTNPLEQFAAALGNIRKRHRTARNLSALETLNDHILRDIGLHRCQIAAFDTMANDNDHPYQRRTA